MNTVTSQWSRLGAMFAVEPAARTPDLERLLLDTARLAGDNARLFILAASWLTRYGAFVAKHRLSRMILEELEPEHRPTLGLLLEWVKERKPAWIGSRFDQAIDACGGALDHRPLLNVERRNARMAELAER